MKINDISTIRYSITNVLNVVRSEIRPVVANYQDMSVSYEYLISTHTNELKLTSNSNRVEQVVRNHLTALRAFMESLHKHPSSAVGTEFSDEFETQLVRHLNSSKLSPRSIIDRKSLLRSWQDTFMSLKSGSSRKSRERKRAEHLPEDMNPFERVLRQGLQNVKKPAKTVAKNAGICPSAVGRWTRGAIPNARSFETIERLERVLKLEKGELMEAYTVVTTGASSSDPYRSRLKEQTAKQYTLKEAEVTPQLASEWKAYLQYKTSRLEPKITRSSRGRWTLVEPSETPLKSTKFIAVNGLICPTAQITWWTFCRFIGYLRLPIEKGGYGLSDSKAQTLAWLADPNAIDAYMQFMSRRSDGLIHGGHKSFAAWAASMTHPRTGYLTQQPSFAHLISTVQAPDWEWKESCEQAMQVSLTWKSDAEDVSRNPSAPIQFLLDQDEPLKPIFSAMRRLRDIGDRAGSGTINQAVARRDELLLGFLLANPLRKTNMVTLTYKSNNTGKVYLTANGHWRIKLRGTTFKNRKRVGGETYDVPIASWLAPLLRDYIQIFRPVLCKGRDSEYLFVTQDGEKYTTLSEHVAELTKRHIPGCSGFSMHAFRHLVATVWLTKHPNDFLTVAELLNDTIAVVIKDYAHLKKDVAFSRHDAYVSSIM